MGKRKLSKTNLYDLMVEIIEYLVKHDMFFDTSIYVNGKCYSSNSRHDSVCKNIAGTSVYESDCDDPSRYIEYCNKETITMTFEGPLYEELNYGNAHDELEKIFNKYGLYFEQGYAWSLAAYYL